MNWIAKNRVWLIAIAAAAGVLLLVGGVYAQTANAPSSSQINTAGSGFPAVPGGEPAGITIAPQPGTSVPQPVTQLPGTAGAATAKQSAASTPRATKRPSHAPATKPSQPPTFAVAAIFWNDTTTNKATGIRVVLGSNAPWSPNTAKAKDTGPLGKAPLNRTLTLSIYLPNSATPVKVAVRFAPIMQPNSVRDAINIDVSDKTVRVLGNPVENFDVSFDRP